MATRMSHPAEHLHAARHAGAVHGGHDRLVELDAAEHGPYTVVDAVAVDLLHLARGDLSLELGHLGDVGLEIGAEQKALPTPVMMATHASSSSPKRSHARGSWAK